MTADVEELVTRIIEEHMLVGPRPGQCLCGWGLAVSHLGKRHSAHIVHELRVRGLLRENLRE